MADTRLQELREFVTEVDGNLHRAFPFTVEKVAATGNKDDLPGTYFVNGLASVYNKWSLDLGGFRERIKPGAFDRVLKEDPHVLHVIDHDTSKTLSSTQNGTLELKSVKDGLHYHSKVAPTSYAKDLEILLNRGDITQSSFAFTVGEDEWRIKEENGIEIVERDVKEVDGLFDVTTCAMGAYPQTEASLAVRSLATNKPVAVSFAGVRTIPESRVVDQEDLGISYLGAALGAMAQFVDTEDADSDANDIAEALAISQRIEALLADELVEDEAEDASDRKIGRSEERASTKDVAPGSVGEPESPEQREARERERELWRQKRLADHRRTREFAFGVHNNEGEEKQ